MWNTSKKTIQLVLKAAALLRGEKRFCCQRGHQAISLHRVCNFQPTAPAAPGPAPAPTGQVPTKGERGESCFLHLRVNDPKEKCRGGGGGGSGWRPRRPSRWNSCCQRPCPDRDVITVVGAIFCHKVLSFLPPSFRSPFFFFSSAVPICRVIYSVVMLFCTVPSMLAWTRIPPQPPLPMLLLLPPPAPPPPSPLVALVVLVVPAKVELARTFPVSLVRGGGRSAFFLLSSTPHKYDNLFAQG